MSTIFQGTVHLRLNKRHTIKLLQALNRIYPYFYIEKKRDINTGEEYIKVGGMKYWFEVTFEKGIKAFNYSNFSAEAFDEKYRAMNHMLELLAGKKLVTSVLKSLKQLLVVKSTKDGENIILMDNKPITPQDDGYDDILMWLNIEDY